MTKKEIFENQKTILRKWNMFQLKNTHGKVNLKSMTTRHHVLRLLHVAEKEKSRLRNRTASDLHHLQARQIPSGTKNAPVTNSDVIFELIVITACVSQYSVS